MKSFRDKFASNRSPKHFIAYSLSFMGYGCIITSLGPLIPYLSTYTGNSETQYAFLFFCRSIGFLTGALVLKLLQSKFTFHKILFFTSIILAIFQILFCLILDITFQGLIKFFISALCCLIEITVNLCVLETQRNENIDFWMLICHGQFSIGGLIGPILVYFFEIYSFAVMGLMILIVAPAYYFLKTPENHQHLLERVSKTSYLSEMKNSGHDCSFFVIESHKKLKIISRQIQILTSFMFLLFLALECSYGSWISSYSVLQGITTKQEATKFSSIFWISITVSRFISSLIPSQSIKKLLFLGYSFLVCSLLTIILIFCQQRLLALLFSAVTFGICYSAMFPLLMSVPAQYNFKVSPQQGASFMMWAAIGQGVVATLTGYLMTWFSNNMLFYSILFTGSIILLSTHLLKYLYKKQLHKDDESTSIQMNQIMITKD